MADYGLLLSMAVTLGLPSLFTRRWPLETTDGRSVTDLAIPVLGVGLLVGRVVHLLLDDPRSLTRLGDFLIIRSGVEFWAGAAAGLLVVVRGARKDHVAIAARLADITPAALVAQAGYHVACIVRDGCYGPQWGPGPTPKGLSRGMLPIELLAGGFLIVTAILLASRSRRSVAVLLLGTGAVAAERSVTSIWLPRLGSEITRQHMTSIAVSAACAIGLVVLLAAHRSRRTRPLPSLTS